ncbi:hypothetical protein, conserved [Leishmania tarentolae]|uniref:DUF3456 domain-containing protein n=1 Tax=Leishmania tarentolae TaxID=5689 RepID=A0A640KPX2_LEITA|nr:hypothetical protein, conserved [Leishmania tarentolae]
MRTRSTFLLAPLKRRQRHWLLAVAALLVSLLLASPDVLAATPSQGKSIRPLHGDGYEHLDCSACIAVARTLFERLNKTLAENPSTYLISHRLSKQNQLRRRQYRNSELLVTEVMENMCTSYKSDIRSLRLHPKSKVRLYHQQTFGDMNLGVRHALREDEVYPADTDPAKFADKRDGHLYPIAKLYSPKDASKLQGLESLSATPTMCALLVEEFEEEIEGIIKVVHSLEEAEYSLCGMPLPVNGTRTTLVGEADEAEVGSLPTITNVCADVEVLRAAARRDQQRWDQYQLREEKRKAKMKTDTADSGSEPDEEEEGDLHEPMESFEEEPRDRLDDEVTESAPKDPIDVDL